MDAGPADRYLSWADFVADDSPCFADWARGAVADAEILAWLSDLQVPKQQPNLVFAAARWHGAAAPAPYDELRRVLLDEEEAVKETIRSRATQTNEAGRLATLTPAFGLVDGPIALIEVGASAGLCLYPDRYDYAWSHGELLGSGGPLLEATSTGSVPVPKTHPAVAWRAGVDLNPLDVRDEDEMAWLEMLIWPEHDDRRARLREAIYVARQDPPDLRRGNLLDVLPGLVEEASAYGTPVVFHSAVILYLDEGDRDRFHDLMTKLVSSGSCHWVSNEVQGVLPRVDGGLKAPAGHFVVGLDGVPTAFANQHGRRLDWL